MSLHTITSSLQKPDFLKVTDLVYGRNNVFNDKNNSVSLCETISFHYAWLVKYYKQADRPGVARGKKVDKQFLIIKLFLKKC